MNLKQLLAIRSQALQAVQPSRCLPDKLRMVGDELEIEGRRLPGLRVHLLALGKAGRSLAAAARDLLGERLRSGLIISHEAQGLAGFEHLQGGHPLPDERSFAAGARLLKYADALPREDTLLVLLSGGASALLEHPLPGVSREEIVQLHDRLLKSGLPIQEMNRQRSQLSAIKGGRLRAHLPENRCTLVLCDVVGGPLEAVGSGPTAGDPLVLLADQRTMLEAAPGIVYCAELIGEARQVGEELARLSCQQPTLWKAAGETTVTVTGKGRGGRCQELVLSWALQERPDSLLLAASSDGQDGPIVGIAGAWADGESVRRAKKLGLDPARLLADNDSFAFFEALGQHVPGAPSGTNTNDLILLYRAGPGPMLEKLGTWAAELDMRAYAVGGMVRDQLLGREHEADIDIAVEGDAIRLAKHVATKLDAPLRVHPRFGTATVMSAGYEIDIATTRRESYPKPGALPLVEPASLAEDLFRRDFTVNAMALDLTSGEIVDPFDGQRDLELRQLRVLHDRSFEDDPTRVLRGIRMEQRLGFTFEARTGELLRGVTFETLTRERLRDEALLCLPYLERMEQLDLLRRIDPRLRLTRAVKRRLAKTPQENKVLLRVLLSSWSKSDLADLGNKFRYTLPNHFSPQLLRLRTLPPSQQRRLLQRLEEDELVFLTVLLPGFQIPVFAPPMLRGEHLIERGLKPGPEFKQLLEEAYDRQLDNGNRP